MIDRDALACTFSAYNCAGNGLLGGDAIHRHEPPSSEPDPFGPKTEISTGLGFEGTDEMTFDLVVSNLPAKAGEPVLKAFFDESLRRLSPGGFAAVVIVEPLAAFARDYLGSIGAHVIDTEKTASHSVFVYEERAGEKPPYVRDLPVSLKPYIRNSASFELEGLRYSLDTVYNVPDFDTIGHETLLAAKLVAEYAATAGACLVWNPGQGHIPACLVQKSWCRILLASRDILQLKTTEHNLRGSAVHQESISAPAFEVVGERIPQGSLNLVVLFVDEIPDRDGTLAEREAIDGLLMPGGIAVAVGSATGIGRLEKHRTECTVIADKKKKTARGIVLRRK
jgi:hypothetical protein